MAGSPATFRDLIAANKRNSAILVVIFCLFVVLVGMVLGLGVLAYVDPAIIRHLNLQQAGLVGLVSGGLALFLSLIAYYGGDQMILTASSARPIAHDDDPELFNVVEEMSIAAGLPMPKVYKIPDMALNAFATGRDPEHATVAITEGLRRKLTREELQGVIAHEMSHVRNYDIRLMMLLAVLVGSVAMMSDLFWQIIWRSGGRSSSSNDDKGSGLILLAVMVVATVLALIAPILAQIIQLAVSRQREYLADASGVELTRNPIGLARALQKIDSDKEPLQSANQGTAHLYIANPLKRFQGLSDSIFSSHPPIQDRIRRLQALTREPEYVARQ